MSKPKAPMTVGELLTLLSRAPDNLPVQLSIGESHEWLHDAAWDNLEKFAVLMAHS